MPALFLTPGHLFRPLPTLYFSRPPYFFAHALAYKADFFRLARCRRKKERGDEHYKRAGADVFLYAPFLHRSGRIFYTGAGHFFWTLTTATPAFCTVFAYFWSIYLRIFTYFWTYLHPFISIFIHTFAHIFAHINTPMHTYAHLHTPSRTPIPASLYTYTHMHISVKSHSWAFKRLSAGLFFPSGGICPHPHTRICLSRALRCPKFQF